MSPRMNYEMYNKSAYGTLGKSTHNHCADEFDVKSVFELKIILSKATSEYINKTSSDDIKNKNLKTILEHCNDIDDRSKIIEIMNQIVDFKLI